MLEDDFTYVLKKALLGNGLAPAQAAERAGIAEADVLSVLRGAFSRDTASRLAPVLGLNAAAFAAHAEYDPAAVESAFFERIELPFEGEHVNAWLIRHGGVLVLIDAGYRSQDLLDALQKRCGRLPDRVFITHGHRDHVGAIGDLLAAGVPVHADEIEGTISMKPLDTVFCGSMAVSACDLSGHYRPALGFHLEGLGQPVLVTGDAVFAGSIGGCGTPEIYQHALRQIRTVMTGLPGNTILLPGHGPATTMGEERVSNPFL
jgi:glyoxylase-like metal-dependent hydrolase (beta-lactamase superfamily II)